MFSNKITIFLFLSMAIFLGGCVPKGAQGVGFSNFQLPKNEKAMIYVYRPGDNFLDPFQNMNYTVIVDDGESNRTVGVISDNAYADIQVPANKEIELWTLSSIGGTKNSFIIETEPNKIYCVKLGISSEPRFNGAIIFPFFELVDTPTCQKEIIKTRRHE